MNRQKRKYALDEILHFGKYRGKTLRWVLDNHQEYVMWCLSNIQSFGMSDEALDYAVNVSSSFGEYRQSIKYEAVPYSEGVEILIRNPWYKRRMENIRNYAVDVHAIELLSLPKWNGNPKQLSLW